MNIRIENWDKGRRVSQAEGKAFIPPGSQVPAAEEIDFTLTFYHDQVSLNIPATSGGLEFIAYLTGILGAPALEPTVKCSCSWGSGIMGAMYLVLWNIPPGSAPQSLEALQTFLGISSGQ